MVLPGDVVHKIVNEGIARVLDIVIGVNMI